MIKTDGTSIVNIIELVLRSNLTEDELNNFTLNKVDSLECNKIEQIGRDFFKQCLLKSNFEVNENQANPFTNKDLNNNSEAILSHQVNTNTHNKKNGDSITEISSFGNAVTHAKYLTILNKTKQMLLNNRGIVCDSTFVDIDKLNSGSFETVFYKVELESIKQKLEKLNNIDNYNCRKNFIAEIQANFNEFENILDNYLLTTHKKLNNWLTIGTMAIKYLQLCHEII